MSEAVTPEGCCSRALDTDSAPWNEVLVQPRHDCRSPRGRLDQVWVPVFFVDPGGLIVGDCALFIRSGQTLMIRCDESRNRREGRESPAERKDRFRVALWIPLLELWAFRCRSRRRT